VIFVNLKSENLEPFVNKLAAGFWVEKEV